MSRSASFTVALIAALAACTGHEPPVSETPPPTPNNPAPPAPRVQLRGMIASVQLSQDCPDPPAETAKPTSPATGAPAQPIMRERAAGDVAPGAALPGDGQGWSQPCTQSTVQLALSHDGTAPQAFRITAARVINAVDGKQVATLPVRGPMVWDDDGRYVAWDESLPRARELKVSYKLGAPAGVNMEDALGPHELRLVLELDVTFDGRTITLRSPEFQREEPHVIVT